MSDKVATGVSRAVTEKNAGWVEFEIDVGSQYPVRVATKQDEVIELGRAAHRGGQAMDWLYTEKESDKINEKSGKPFVNRYLNGVEVAGSNPDANGSPTAAAQVHASSNGVEGMSKEEWRRKDSAADKRALTAIAVSALTHTMPSEPTEKDLATFLERVDRLVLTWHAAIARERDELPFI